MKTHQGDTDEPADNLREKGVCFYKEPANVGKIGDNFFINRTIPLWNDLPVELKEANSLKSFNAGLDKQHFLKVVNGFLDKFTSC